jgi:hypothetical protein
VAASAASRLVLSGRHDHTYSIRENVILSCVGIKSYCGQNGGLHTQTPST